MNLARSLIVVVILAVGATPALATTIGITSAGSLDANAYADLALLGNDFDLVAQNSMLALTGAPSWSVSFSNANQLLTRVDQGATWGGNFTEGEALLWSGGFDQSLNVLAGGLLTLDFSSNVSGVGAQIQRNEFGAFQATIAGYGASGLLLGSFSVNGLSTGLQDGSAVFLGLYDPDALISRVTFDISGGDFAINNPLVNTTAPEPIPEPSTVTLLGLGLAAVARRLRRTRQ